MGLITNDTTKPEIIAIVIHCISLISLGLVIYLTYNRNNLVSFFSVANIGQHCSKLFRLIFFGFTMKNAPHWSCYVHAYTNFLTVGMESYIAMLFALRLWLMITKKNMMKMWLLEHNKILTYVCGLGIPFILSFFSILPQLIKGNSFVIPDDAENCITGFRQNAWQIILSGPGTTLPPFLLSASFGVHIAIVVCTVSTQNIMKDVKKFSTISYSSWIRMLWFGIFFSLVVVVNIIGDINNSRNMINYGTPEPGIYKIGIPYYITAAVGVGVLLIFGTTVEAKKKLSTLFKSSMYGITSTFVNSSKSKSQNKSQNKSLNQSQNVSSIDVSANYNTSNITIDSNATLIPKSNSKSNGDNMIMPNIKNSVKPKLPAGEYEASLEFNKFMKSVNNAVKEESDLRNESYYGSETDINYYSQNPPKNRVLSNGNITPRMMIPIQKFSPQRMQQQYNQIQLQHQQKMQHTLSPTNSYNNFKIYDENEKQFYDDDDKSLLNKYPNKDTFINIDNLEGDEANYQQNYIRNATYTEEILYPAKASTSMKLKHVK